MFGIFTISSGSGFLTSRELPETQFSTILVVDPVVVLILVVLSHIPPFNWKSRLSKDMTNPGWKDFLNSCSSRVAANNSGEVISAIPRFSLIIIVEILSFTFISLVFSSEIWSLAVIRSASWSFPSFSSSLLSMLELELVSLSLLNLEIVAYQRRISSACKYGNKIFLLLPPRLHAAGVAVCR